MSFFLFILLSFLTTNCEKNNQEVIYPPDPKWELADKIYDNEIGKKVSHQLREEKKLYTCESGWGLRGKEKIQVMHCGFFYYDEVDIDQARELLLTAGNLYLTTINENERMRPFLEVYPFTLENIEIAIFLQNRDGSEIPAEKLCVISFEKGILTYRTHASNANSYFKIVCEEQYKEALKKSLISKKKLIKEVI